MGLINTMKKILILAFFIYAAANVTAVEKISECHIDGDYVYCDSGVSVHIEKAGNVNNKRMGQREIYRDGDLIAKDRFVMMNYNFNPNSEIFSYYNIGMYQDTVVTCYSRYVYSNGQVHVQTGMVCEPFSSPPTG
jgi:hypothetical protein